MTTERKKFYLERKEDWNGWLIKERATGNALAFSSDFHGAQALRDFMEVSKQKTEQT